jgi:hypothetical protein
VIARIDDHITLRESSIGDRAHPMITSRRCSIDDQQRVGAASMIASHR